MNEHETSKAIPLVEEHARVSKREVVTGKVTVRTGTDEHEDIVRESLGSETVEVVRVPIGMEVQVAPEVRTEGDVLIVPVFEERLVIEKRLVLTEEVHIRRRRAEEPVEVPVSVRSQHAVVERSDERGIPHPDRTTK